MFTITSTRIVGLIAGVCAAVVAPQALAATSTHNTVPQPGDPTQNGLPTRWPDPQHGLHIR